MAFRMTQYRQEVLQLFRSNPRKFFTVADVAKIIGGADLSTVYRAIELFEEEGVIRSIPLGGDEARYEYQDKGHHHAVCSGCGHLEHFDIPSGVLKKIPALNHFDLENVEITIHGKCRHM